MKTAKEETSNPKIASNFPVFNQLHLPLDEEGMVDRECPQDDCQPKYFKIFSSIENEQEKRRAIKYLYCPYCGYRNYFNNFTTHEQIEWVKSLMLRDVHRTFDNLTLP